MRWFGFFHKIFQFAIFVICYTQLLYSLRFSQGNGAILTEQLKLFAIGIGLYLVVIGTIKLNKRSVISPNWQILLIYVSLVGSGSEAGRGGGTRAIET